MDIEKYTPLYTKLDEEYQKLYSSDQTINSWYSRPFVGDAYGTNIWYLDFLDDGRLSKTSLSLLKAGRTATPYYTQIIDLTKSIEELHADVRKSYKSLLNFKKKGHVISRLSDVEPLRKLHIQAHGRETRTYETWFVQQKMLWKRQVFALLESKFLRKRDPHSDISLAGGLFYYNSHICYYGVGCSVEGAGSHALIWEAIKYAKELGCKEFDMGQQVFNAEPTPLPVGGRNCGLVFDGELEKLVNISKFKRGFGGETKVYLEFKP